MIKEVVINRQTLAVYLKKMIIESLRIEDIATDDIEDDMPLFKDGLGLDSIDALELVVAIEKNFNVVIADEDIGKKAFASINALAEFIQNEFKG